jgi:two-component system cell cycle sensor histidine kinase/response regulator CckA
MNQGTQTTKTILVVDDDVAVLSLITAIFAGSEFTTLTAVSGQDALKRSREFPGTLDLLLSDFQMPGMSGLDLATALTLARPEIKVLLMSGFPSGMLVLNEGWHFLAKPFAASQLRALVTGLLDPGKHSRFSVATPGEPSVI